MAKLTGRIIQEKYAPGRRVVNSFYEEQPANSKIGSQYMTGQPETVYFIYKNGELSAKETMALW